MSTKVPSGIKHLDRDGRLTLRRQGVTTPWRVVSADRNRVDPAADYLFCAPDFLFPVESSARALRIEIDGPPAATVARGRSKQTRRPQA